MWTQGNVHYLITWTGVILIVAILAIAWTIAEVKSYLPDQEDSETDDREV